MLRGVWMIKKEKITVTVDGGKTRRYYFDVKTTKTGDKYLQINEYNVRNKKGNKIIIFPEYLEKFHLGFGKSVEELLKL